MQREDFLERLGLPAVQVRRTVIDAEQRRYVKAIRSKSNGGGGVVANLYRIGRIERPHLFEIVEGETGIRALAGKGLELVRRIHDAGVHGWSILHGGGGIAAVEDLAFGPFDPAMTGGAELSKDSLPRSRVGRLGLVQWAHGGKDPQCLRIEGVASSLRDAVVIDRGVGDGV